MPTQQLPHQFSPSTSQVKVSSKQTNVRATLSHPLLFSAAKRDGRIQIPMETRAERGSGSPARKHKDQAEKGIASEQDHNTKGLPTDPDGKESHVGRQCKGLGQSDREFQSMHACTEQPVHVQQS